VCYASIMLARLALVLLLLSCKKDEDKPKAPPPPSAADVATMTEDQIVDAALKSMATISSLARKHGADCEALAKSLADHATTHRPLIDAFKKLSANEAKQQEIAQKHGGTILKLGQDTVAALSQHCGNHPAVKDLFNKLN
jgi:transposase-like protein